MAKTAKNKMAELLTTGHTNVSSSPADTVTKEAYDKLLAAFEAVLSRQNLDIQLHRKYRTVAGLL